MVIAAGRSGCLCCECSTRGRDADDVLFCRLLWLFVCDANKSPRVTRRRACTPVALQRSRLSSSTNKAALAGFNLSKLFCTDILCFWNAPAPFNRPSLPRLQASGRGVPLRDGSSDLTRVFRTDFFFTPKTCRPPMVINMWMNGLHDPGLARRRSSKASVESLDLGSPLHALHELESPMFDDKVRKAEVYDPFRWRSCGGAPTRWRSRPSAASTTRSRPPRTTRRPRPRPGRRPGPGITARTPTLTWRRPGPPPPRTPAPGARSSSCGTLTTRDFPTCRSAWRRRR